jgi:hypothetical protein
MNSGKETMTMDSYQYELLQIKAAVTPQAETWPVPDYAGLSIGRTAKTTPMAGFSMGNVLPEAASTHCPSIMGLRRSLTKLLTLLSSRMSVAAMLITGLLMVSGIVAELTRVSGHVMAQFQV